MRVLVVEDNLLLAHHLSERLGEANFQVKVATDGREGLHFALEEPHDLAIIDLGLPGMDGFELIRSLRQAGQTLPVLVLTARGNWEDKVEALQLGADDYVVKPFQFEELSARLNALLRRAAGFVQPRIQGGPVVLDLNRRQAFAADEPLPLTLYEYRILEYLMLHHRQAVTKERLLSVLYEDGEERDPNVVEVLVGRLRRKLEAAVGVKPIETVRGRGYLYTFLCR